MSKLRNISGYFAKNIGDGIVGGFDFIFGSKIIGGLRRSDIIGTNTAGVSNGNTIEFLV